MSSVAKLLRLILYVVGLVWVIDFVLFRPIKFVNICHNTPLLVCETVEAEFSYDPMDGVFLIDKIYVDKRNAVEFSPACTATASGGVCANPFTNEKYEVTASALKLKTWRWDLPPHPEKY